MGKQDANIVATLDDFYNGEFPGCTDAALVSKGLG